MNNRQTRSTFGNAVTGPGYDKLLRDLKARISRAQIKAGLAVNAELVRLFWEIGKGILIQEKEQGWGARVIDKLAKDLKAAFPEMRGFSARNLRYMKSFAEAYPNEQFLQAAPAKITWYHNCTLLDKVKDPDERHWYAIKTIEFGWSRDILVLQIESRLYARQGQSAVNFDRTLPAPQSDLARQILKDPYNFDFLSLDTEAHEKDIEKGLLDQIRLFLLELGVGFAFVGSQYHLGVAGEDFYLDLLFYHLQLRCYIVIELKAAQFKPEYTGKMNFYLSAVDDLLRHPDDKPSIGMILCKTKNKIVAEYALRDTNKPIGISEYKITELLPEDFRGSLPTIEELEKTLTIDDIAAADSEE